MRRMNNQYMYYPPQDVHDSSVQRRTACPRGPMPQGHRPRGGRAGWALAHGQYDNGPHAGGFVSHTPSVPRFPFCCDRFAFSLGIA